jgi:pilus assembly protein CpaF
MTLFQRMKAGSSSVGKTQVSPPERSQGTLRAVRAPAEHEWQELKSRVHNALFDYLDLSRIGSLSEEQVAHDVNEATRLLLDREQALLGLEERERLVREIQHEVFGLGPLEPLLQDTTVNDVLVNGCSDVRVERFGRLEKTVARFKDDAHLMRIIDKIVSSVGRRIDESTPMVDARLADGSRVNVIIPPLALDGPMMSIRRFAADPFTAADLVELGTLSDGIVALVQAIVRARLNVLISGGTGAGKTTLLNVLSSFVPKDERIVTIEDAAELQLKQGHVIRLETRPPNLEGNGRVTARDLVINSLRMRPDRIIVGEVRGPEALDMLQAMNTGHDGSLTTVHANSPRDALSRVETMVAMSNLGIPQRAVREQIASAIDVVIQVSRLSDGRRRLVSLQEVTGMEGDIVTMQEIFKFERRGIDEQGNVLGDIAATGIRPSFAEKVRLSGIELEASIFEPRRVA